MFQNSCKRSKIEFESASQTPFFKVAHFDAPTMLPSMQNNKGNTIKDVNNKCTRSETMEEDRKRIISFLSNRLLEGNGPPKLICGVLSECASHFGHDVLTISQIWKKARTSYAHTQTCHNGQEKVQEASYQESASCNTKEVSTTRSESHHPTRWRKSAYPG